MALNCENRIHETEMKASYQPSPNYSSNEIVKSDEESHSPCNTYTPPSPASLCQAAATPITTNFPSFSSPSLHSSNKFSQISYHYLDCDTSHTSIPFIDYSSSFASVCPPLEDNTDQKAAEENIEPSENYKEKQQAGTMWVQEYSKIEDNFKLKEGEINPFVSIDQESQSIHLSDIDDPFFHKSEEGSSDSHQLFWSDPGQPHYFQSERGPLHYFTNDEESLQCIPSESLDHHLSESDRKANISYNLDIPASLVEQQVFLLPDDEMSYQLKFWGIYKLCLWIDFNKMNKNEKLTP